MRKQIRLIGLSAMAEKLGVPAWRVESWVSTDSKKKIVITDGWAKYIAVRLHEVRS